MDYLKSLEFCGCGAPQLAVIMRYFYDQRGRFDLIFGTLQKGELYAVKDIVQSKAFFKSFPLIDSKPWMASGVEDKAEEKNTGDAAYIPADKGKSLYSEDPTNFNSSSKIWSDSQLPPELRSDG
ncbi:hypothetical protein Acr_12g0001460 [Actinidia rufa]|uniref:Uncharacterized protein n=1 Tax=Actinidia rufa TaxID=165716 RepID=A0A7J0FG15_9ERIC|nr:hypothetical protein Acr_12g0001460 [Actinidia rufa]